MCTLSEAVFFANEAYSDHPVGSHPADPSEGGVWTLMLQSAQNTDGYSGAAWQNSVTHEVIVANRGTRFYNYKDLWSDILAHADEENKFIANVAQATADTFQKFGALLAFDPDVRAAFVKGFQNLALGGIQSQWVGLQILDQVAADLGVSSSPLLRLIASEAGIVTGLGSVALAGAGESDVLFGGQGPGGVGSNTLMGGAGYDSFVFALPTSGSASETIQDVSGHGQVSVVKNGNVTVLGGTASNPLVAVPGSINEWEDSAATLYQFNPLTHALTITNGSLGSGNEIVIDNFNIGPATVSNGGGPSVGYLGFHLANTLSLSAGTGSSSVFPAGSDQSYILSIAAASATPQTVKITLSGAIPSDFAALIGNSTVALNPDGTFSVTLPAGETSITFGLVDTTADNGSSDIAGGTTLTLSASVPNPLGGNPIQANPLAVHYVPGSADTTQSPHPGNALPGRQGDFAGTEWRCHVATLGIADEATQHLRLIGALSPGSERASQTRGRHHRIFQQLEVLGARHQRGRDRSAVFAFEPRRNLVLSDAAWLHRNSPRYFAMNPCNRRATRPVRVNDPVMPSIWRSRLDTRAQHRCSPCHVAPNSLRTITLALAEERAHLNVR